MAQRAPVALLVFCLLAASTIPPAALGQGWSFAQNIASNQARAQVAAQARQVTGGNPNWQPNDGQLHTWWQEFKRQFGKQYSTSAEATAKAAFRANIANVYKVNADASIPYTLSGNQ